MPQVRKGKPNPAADALVPPDRKQCQCLRKDGNFMTLGPVTQKQCENKPIVIVTEKKSTRKDKKKGSMSLCAHCWGKMIEQLGKKFMDADPITENVEPMEEKS